jgi:hypothetical protein
MQLSYIHILQADAYISQLKTTNNRFGSVIAPVALGFRDSLRRRMADRKDKEPPSEKRKVTTDLALEYGTPDSPGYHTLASLMGRDGEYAIFRKFSSLNMLNLMTLQAELLELENRYKETLYMDERNEKGIPLATSFMALRKSNSRQKEVLEEIRKKLDEYSRWQCS